MSFDYCIAYEDRACFHTSRWLLDGVNTTPSGNTAGGWLWLSCQRAADTVTVELFKDAACGSGDKVAAGTADVSDIDGTAACCTLAEANGSGLSGELYFERYTVDAAAAPVLVSLCTDADLADEYQNLADLPDSVYAAAVGMARYCAVATRKILLLVSQMYADSLGGFGPPEHRYHSAASRAAPDFRRIASPDQLTEAAVHWALMLAFGSCHERGGQTMYSQLRDYHDARRREAIAGWNLTLNTDPDTDDNADARRAPASVRVTRL